VFTGSRKLFAALLDRCIARKVVPICYFTPNTNSTPSLVALIPQEEELDGSNIQILPPGFHVVYLPYCGKCYSFSCIKNMYFEVYEYF
jgi:ATP-dependent DNA helicase 2 subunit 1